MSKPILLFLVAFFTASSAQARTCLNWEDEGLSSNYTVNGLDVNFDYSDNFIGADAFPTYSVFPNDIFGGHTGYFNVSFDNNNVNINERVTLVLTFSSPVRNLEFSVLDIDQSSWDDNITIDVDGTNAKQTTYITLAGNAVIADNESYFDGWEGRASAASTSDDGNIDFDSGNDQVTAVTMQYFTGDDAGSNPNSQRMGLSDVCWDTEVDLVVNKTDLSGNFSPGEIVNYQITVTNNGPMNATDVNVTDIFPAGSSLSGNWSCSSSNASCVAGSPVGSGASGNSDINQQVDINVGGSVTFSVPLLMSTDPSDY